MGIFVLLLVVLSAPALWAQSAGTITTVAGDGMDGYSGDGGAATSAEISQNFTAASDTQGNIYIADMGSNVIGKVSSARAISTIAGRGTGN
jgi:hypothetical protein